MRGWRAWFWRLRIPTVCRLHAGDPGNPVVSVSLSPKACDPGEPMTHVPAQGQEMTELSPLSEAE